MDLHHPPVSSFDGNQLYYLCGWLAQMLLTFMQYAMLPRAARTVGLRPLIRDVFCCVAQLTKSGRRVTMNFSKRIRRERLAWLLHAWRHYDAWWATAPG